MVQPMKQPTRHIRTAVVLVVIATLLFAGACIDAAVASAHPVTEAMCKRSASAHIQSHGEPNLDHWRADYARCQAYRRKHNLRHTCERPRPTVTGVQVKHRWAGVGQRRNLTRALNLGRRMGVPRSHQVALVAAATQEQSAYNRPYGHGTSVGFLQLISVHEPDGVGYDWRMQITNSAGWFLRGARKLDPGGRRAPGELAQDVQASAHPTLYRQWVGEARRTVTRFYGPCVR